MENQVNTIATDKLETLGATDKLETLGTATIQHGSVNKRVYLMDVGMENPAHLIEQLKQLSSQKGYTKIFAKVPEKIFPAFKNSGFEDEAIVPKFFNNKESCIFSSLYLDKERENEKNSDLLEKVLEKALEKSGADTNINPKNDFLQKSGYSIRKCEKKDTPIMADIYKKVFKTYPFPIHNPDYIAETMDDNIAYFCIEKQGVPIALSSAEMDMNKKSVEMTDFATLPEYTGSGFALFLLKEMEKFVYKKGFKLCYTIARAASFGMNITFSKNSYTYAGRLKNNTNISGSIESMNIWYKTI